MSHALSIHLPMTHAHSKKACIAKAPHLLSPCFHPFGRGLAVSQAQWKNKVEKPSRWQVVSTTPGTLVQITERANCITSLFGASLNSTLSSSNLAGITFTKQLSTMNCMGFRDLTNNNETWEVLDFPHFFRTFRYNTKQDQQQTQSSAPFNQLLSNWIRCSWPPFHPAGHPFNCQILPTLLTSGLAKSKDSPHPDLQKNAQMPECGLKKIHLKFLTWQNHRKTYPKYVWNLINPKHPGRSIIIQNDGMSLHDQAIQGDLLCIGLHALIVSFQHYFQIW